MSKTLGLREQHKRATRAALRDAAKRLFAEHGYQATTVRDIADAAGVTERTFYRYFDGKEGLLAEEALAWIDKLQDAIRKRPRREPTLVALQRAIVSVVEQAEAEIGPGRSWLVSDGPRPFELLRRSTPRPLLRVETAITDAILARATKGSPTVPGAEFQAQVLARVAVAALRSAVIRHRQLQTHADTGSPGVAHLLQDAFTVIDQRSATHP